MNPIVKLLLVQLLLFFCACSVSETDIQTYSEDDFKTIIKLSEERKMTKTILSIRDFLIKDSSLFVCNSRNDSIFMIFNVNTMECIKSWGIKGRGPGE